MRLMISPGTHKLVNVSEPREWSSQYGDMKTYTVKVEGDEAAYQLNKKAASAAPTIGQEIVVETVTPDPEGKWPAKLKLAAPNKGGFNGGGGMSPEREAKIVRQHSQGMALQYAAIKQAQGTLPDDFKPSDLFKIADLFDHDANGAKP